MPDYNEFLSKYEDMISYYCVGSPKNEPILLIHGFLGSKLDWRNLLERLPSHYFYIVIDLPGHGESLSDIPTLSKFSIALDALLKKITSQPCTVLGYSMGGRIGLYFTEQYPKSVKAIGLISASFGIQDEHEKKIRYASDMALAHKIETGSMNAFIETWYRLPLFGNLRKHPHFASFIERRSNNNPKYIADALRQYSVAQHDYFGPIISTLPCLYIAGELDKKYAQICVDIQHLNPKAHCHIVPECGHAVHIEEPQAMVNLTCIFLTSFLEQGKTKIHPKK